MSYDISFVISLSVYRCVQTNFHNLKRNLILNCISTAEASFCVPFHLYILSLILYAFYMLRIFILNKRYLFLISYKGHSIVVYVKLCALVTTSHFGVDDVL